MILPAGIHVNEFLRNSSDTQSGFPIVLNNCHFYNVVLLYYLDYGKFNKRIFAHNSEYKQKARKIIEGGYFEMAYTMLRNQAVSRNYLKNTLEQEALSFIREDCQGLGFDRDKVTDINDTRGKKLDFEGTSIKRGQIPFNMEKDIDRLCLENAVDGFLKSGKKEDAFNVYFCWLEIFIGNYEKTRRMIEFLSEFEANGNDYSHSAYVFCLGLAIYESNSVYREIYKKYYKMEDEHEAAGHYLQYWGLASLFHDMGYPFEPSAAVDAGVKQELKKICGGKDFSTVNELFAYVLANKLGGIYGFTEEQMYTILAEKPAGPEKFNRFTDPAYFSAVVLFKKLFCELECELTEAYLDALTAILMHNSLYRSCIAHYKGEENKPFKAELHPLAYMLMLCDKLQRWDRTAYSRNSQREPYPVGCRFDFSDNKIKAVYLYDEKETDGISAFREDIERIVDLTDIRLYVQTELSANIHSESRSYLSDSNFINLYNFAIVLNGRWDSGEWKKARDAGQEEKFLRDEAVLKKYTEAFKGLSLEYKLSNINQAKAFAQYMDAIDCFYTDKPVDFEPVESFREDELVKIGIMEHRRWLQEHYDMGWIYGNPDQKDRDFLRQHKDMIPNLKAPGEISEEAAKANYERLDKAEQDKDTEPMECMLSMLKMHNGLRIYRLK